MPASTDRKASSTAQRIESTDAAELARKVLEDARVIVLVVDLHPTLGPLVNFGPLVRLAQDGQRFLRRFLGDAGEPAASEPEPVPVRPARPRRQRETRRAPARRAA